VNGHFPSTPERTYQAPPPGPSIPAGRGQKRPWEQSGRRGCSCEGEAVELITRSGPNTGRVRHLSSIRLLRSFFKCPFCFCSDDCWEFVPHNKEPALHWLGYAFCQFEPPPVSYLLGSSGAKHELTQARRDVVGVPANSGKEGSYFGRACMRSGRKGFVTYGMKLTMRGRSLVQIG
jgi:hypothetical protein